MVRKALREEVQPSIRQLYRAVVDLDRSVATIALELQRRELADES